jgi:hypothetical protein
MVLSLSLYGESFNIHKLEVQFLDTVPQPESSLIRNSRSLGPTLLTCLLTELSFYYEAANCAATEELRSILWKLKVHYRVHKSPPLVPILSQIDPVHTISSYLS